MAKVLVILNKFFLFRGLSLLLLLLMVAVPTAVVAEVTIQKTPDGGLQPRLIQASDGSVHLLYFKKRINQPAAREGNLFYRQYQAGQGRFGLPVRVSSQAFNLQTVSISRAALAIDGEGRVHVMWYLPRQAEYFYTRSDTQRSSFEPQRSMVSEFREGIDAGGDVAARGSEVAIVWGAGDLSREDERSMYARFSHDGGASFGPETMVANPDLGACACCSMATDYLSDSELVVAYRSAIDGIGRHMQVLRIEGVDADLQSGRYQDMHELQQWEATFCPLSTNDISFSSAQDAWLVFETQSRIVKMSLSEPESIQQVAAPFIETRQKNPSIAFNASGDYLIAWGEAISHSRGGRLNYRVFDSSGQLGDERIQQEVEMENFTFPAAAALPNGDFLLLY